MVQVIAIDGPSGSGKSTVARLIADRLDYLYLDTGAMYRAVGLEMLRKGIPCDNELVTADRLASLSINFDDNGRIQLNGADVSEEIRTPAASRAASDYSRLANVRAYLTRLQRQIGSSRPAVLEGRDIGTVVFPDADHKFFLNATPEERARRRHLQLIQTNPDIAVTYEEILRDQLMRDKQDAGRELAPLMCAKDAISIDTTGRTIDEVVEAILQHL